MCKPARGALCVVEAPEQQRVGLGVTGLVSLVAWDRLWQWAFFTALFKEQKTEHLPLKIKLPCIFANSLCFISLERVGRLRPCINNVQGC